ncbi:MAG: hypothetical protein Q7I97_06080 [Thermovirgaceae bacterium]|nr:hypothetical protein [Thermovirgaceae bacterium]
MTSKKTREMGCFEMTEGKREWLKVAALVVIGVAMVAQVFILLGIEDKLSDIGTDISILSRYTNMVASEIRTLGRVLENINLFR